VGLPIVNHDNNQHAANENLRIQNLWDGIEIFAAFIHESPLRALPSIDGPEEIGGWLRQWPRGLALDQRATVRQSLKACCSIFDAPRAVMAWEEREEPWLVVVTLSEDGFTWREAEPDPYLPLVDPAVADISFHDSGTSISSNFRDATGLRDVISAPIRGRQFKGESSLRSQKRSTSPR